MSTFDHTFRNYLVTRAKRTCKAQLMLCSDSYLINRIEKKSSFECGAILSAEKSTENVLSANNVGVISVITFLTTELLTLSIFTIHIITYGIRL